MTRSEPPRPAQGIARASASLPADPLDAISENNLRARRFSDHARRHLVAENAILRPIARARLTRAVLDALSRRMVSRRGLPLWRRRRMLDDFEACNRRWSAQRHAEEPDYFTRLAAQQAPEIFWPGHFRQEAAQ